MNNVICKQCGANTHLPQGVTAAESYCSWCGESLAPPATAAAPEPEAPPEVAAAPPPLPAARDELLSCARCGDLVPRSASTTTRGGTVICHRCDPGPSAPAARELCARCGDLMPEGGAGAIGGATYCARCLALVRPAERDLRWESEFRFLGGYALVIGVLYTLGLGIFALVAMSGALPGMGAAEGIGLLLVTGLAVLISFCGLSLFQQKNWARVTMGVFAVIGALFSLFAGLAGVFGAALYGVIAWMLLGTRGARITTPSYRDLMVLDAGRRRPWSIMLLLLLGAIVVVVLVASLLAAS